MSSASDPPFPPPPPSLSSSSASGGLAKLFFYHTKIKIRPFEKTEILAETPYFGQNSQLWQLSSVKTQWPKKSLSARTPYFGRKMCFGQNTEIGEILNRKRSTTILRHSASYPPNPAAVKMGLDLRHGTDRHGLGSEGRRPAACPPDMLDDSSLVRPIDGRIHIRNKKVWQGRRRSRSVGRSAQAATYVAMQRREEEEDSLISSRLPR